MTVSDIIGYIRDIVVAGVGVAIAFGWDITDDQKAALLLLVPAIAAFVVYLWQRYKVGDGTAVGESK